NSNSKSEVRKDTLMKNELSVSQKETLLETLETRFKENMHRRVGLKWAVVYEKLKANTDKLWALHKMEETGGEPDVVEYDEEKSVYVFYDCCKETPKHRRSVCYDREALEARKKHPPKNNVIDMVISIGIEILTEEQYRKLQQIEAFEYKNSRKNKIKNIVIDLMTEKQYRKLQTIESIDLKTSSWVQTPPEIRERGGSLFCDYRYGHVFVYHNGASSYYSNRGFRGLLRI